MRIQKRTVLTVLSVVLVLLIAAGGTIAYYAARTQTENNEFKFDPGKVTVEENFNGWEVKEVKLKNTSDKISGVMRAMLIPRVENADGDYVEASLGEMAAPIGNNVVMGDFTFVLADDWSTNWFYKDGFYYCRQVIEAGGSTPLLMKKVTLTADTDEMKAKYKDYKIKVDVAAGILQAEGGAPESEWGVTVIGNTVKAS